ncbi:50S ribosomal protein L18 [candidate division SR1 bacterium]|nr:50S ribosomal protein L18 [candidate division SR1 bacterium]
MAYLKNKLLEKQRKYLRRKTRVNTQIKLSHPDFRLVVSKSLLYISADVIDAAGNTVAHFSDKGQSGTTKTDRAMNGGKSFAETLKGKKITKLTFDRNGYLYHGRIKAFADGLRDGGIQF